MILDTKKREKIHFFFSILDWAVWYLSEQLLNLEALMHPKIGFMVVSVKTQFLHLAFFHKNPLRLAIYPHCSQ